jgi:hypothetical protein
MELNSTIFNDRYMIDFWKEIDIDIRINNNNFTNYHSINFQFIKELLIGNIKFVFEDIQENIDTKLYSNYEESISINNKINEIVNNHFEKYYDKSEFINCIINNSIHDIYLSFYQFYNDLRMLDNINDSYNYLNTSNYHATIKYAILLLGMYTSSTYINKNKLSLKDTYMNNPLIIFYICSYIFFDNLLDDITVSSDTKNNISKYIDTLFKLGELPTKNIYNIENKHFKNINNIFVILFNYKKEKYPFLYKSLYSVFKSEVTTAHYQNSNSIDTDTILMCTLHKGKETVLGLWQIFEINKNFRDDHNYTILANHIAMIFQLLDDLDDIQEDIVDKNITIFSYPYLTDYADIDLYLKNNVSKLINYILNINEELDAIDIEYISEEHKKNISIMMLVYLNICISKHENIKNMFIQYNFLFPLDFNNCHEFYLKFYQIKE